MGESRGLFIQDEMSAIDREAAAVAKGEEPVPKVLGEPVGGNQGVEHQPTEGLGEQLLEVLIEDRKRHELPPLAEKPIRDQAMKVRVPLELAAESLNGHHHARAGVLLAEDGGEGAADGQKSATGQYAKQSALAEEELTERDGNGEDPVSVMDRGQDLLAELLSEEQSPPSLSYRPARVRYM